MRPSKVAQLLGPKEFIRLCAKVDGTSGGATKFDVLSVLREGKKLTVVVKTDKNRVITVEMTEE